MIPHRAEERWNDNFVNACITLRAYTKWAEVAWNELLPSKARGVEGPAAAKSFIKELFESRAPILTVPAAQLNFSVSARALFHLNPSVYAVTYVYKNSGRELVIIIVPDLPKFAKRAAIVSHISLIPERLTNFDQRGADVNMRPSQYSLKHPFCR
jgi:hypothetical protein